MTELENRTISLTDADSIAAVLYIDGDADPNNPTEDDVSLRGFVEDGDTGSEILDVLPATHFSSEQEETAYFALTEIDTEGDEGVQTTPAYTWQAYSLEVGIPTDGLIHEWTASEGSGTTLGDSVGDNDAAISGATWVSDIQYQDGEALEYDGVDDGAQVSDTVTELNQNEPWTVEVWVDVADDEDGGTHIIYQGQNGGSDRFAVGIDRDDSDSIAVGFYDGSSFFAQLKTDYTGRGLIQIVVAHDGEGNLTAYDNASEFTTSGNVRTAGSDDQDFRWGQSTSFDSEIEGIIDVTRIWDRELNETEINSLYGAHPST